MLWVTRRFLLLSEFAVKGYHMAIEGVLDLQEVPETSLNHHTC